MGLTKAFQRKVRVVRIRSAANLLPQQAGWALAVAGAPS